MEELTIRTKAEVKTSLGKIIPKGYKITIDIIYGVCRVYTLHHRFMGTISKEDYQKLISNVDSSESK